MNTGTYYLYEYKNNRKLRNTGFLKIARRERTCFLQINARNLPVTSQDVLKLSVFYMENNSANAKHISDISCGNHTIAGRINIPESRFPNQYPLNRIDGFFIVLPQGTVLAALTPNVAFDTRNIMFPAAKNIAAETIESPTETAAPETLETPVEPAAETISPEAVEPPTETAAPETIETPAETISSEVVESPAETPMSDRSETEATATSEETASQETVRKIQRSELSCLPRCHWNIANNSFLLHGYHNYNHLLLIEEDGHHWLGVPGIYDPREARAADLFGFTQFTDSYNNQLALAEDECNSYGRFGYWCRYLK